MKQNKPMTAREEFNKKFCFEYQPNKPGKNNVGTLEVENPDEIWNWHISEMEKLLERVEKEVIGENPKIQDYLSKPIIDFLNSQHQSLNKLKEEFEK